MHDFRLPVPMRTNTPLFGACGRVADYIGSSSKRRGIFRDPYWMHRGSYRFQMENSECNTTAVITQKIVDTASRTMRARGNMVSGLSCCRTQFTLEGRAARQN